MSDWSSDVCSSDLHDQPCAAVIQQPFGRTAAKALVFAVFVQIHDSAVARHLNDHRMRALDRADLAPPTVPMRQRREIAAIPQCEQQIGRAPCRERVCQYVEIQVVAVSVKKKKHKSLSEH